MFSTASNDILVGAGQNVPASPAQANEKEKKMNIPIHIDSMKSAEQFSTICKAFPNEFFLRADQFCVDPKSTLGILAMMYSAKNQLVLDTGDLDDAGIPAFLQAIDSYIIKNEGEENTTA